jgi:glycosyltransferase involved in cell wall biosynthesis
VEFPHPSAFTLVATASALGWLVLYDVLDEWEEFHRVGQAAWYDRAFEEHLCGAADAVVAVNDYLAGRVRALGCPAVEVVPNGLKPGIERVDRVRTLPQGEVTVGYFGHLTAAWFDWTLLAGAARARPGWKFYVIGYGGEPGRVELPGNVQLLGRKPQKELAGWAANWDVAIVPFQAEALAAGADPIKTYEYLAMGLPVVVTGVGAPRGAETLVRRATDLDSFVAAIEAAASEGPETAARRRTFAATCRWEVRLGAILDLLRDGQRVAEKRALVGVPS